jgi:hypothetical protein
MISTGVHVERFQARDSCLPKFPLLSLGSKKSLLRPTPSPITSASTIRFASTFSLKTFRTSAFNVASSVAFPTLAPRLPFADVGQTCTVRRYCSTRRLLINLQRMHVSRRPGRTRNEFDRASSRRGSYRSATIHPLQSQADNNSNAPALTSLGPRQPLGAIVKEIHGSRMQREFDGRSNVVLALCSGAVSRVLLAPAPSR